MREIKFRGRALDSGEWVYGYLLLTDYRAYIHPPRPGLEFGDIDFGYGFIQVIPETVGQFTGLRDKNWEEIYEGDIYLSTYRAGGAGSIRGRYKERIKHVVEWGDRGAWRGRRLEGGHGYGYCHPDCELGEDIEVIGNISENPDNRSLDGAKP